LKENFKHFIKHSIIYSISNVAAKASGIILLPIYTSYFSVEEFGRLGLLIAISTILVQIVVLGQNQSLIKFSNQIEYASKKKSIFFTLFVFILCISAVFVIFGVSLTPWLSKILGNFDDYNSSLRISIYIVAVSIINSMVQNKLRADEKSVSFTIVNLLKLFILIISTVYLVVVARLGINGVLYGQLISEIFVFIVIIPLLIKLMEIRFEKKILIESLRFGIPLIFSALSMTLLNLSDRFLIKFLANEKDLGLYELGYRVAGILNMFMIMPLSLTLLPVAYKIYNQPGDKEYYRKIMTYATYLLVWGALALSIFSEEIIELFSGNISYIPSYQVVPVLLFSYVFFGMSMISSLGLYVSGKTTYIATITISAAAINIALNFILIPSYGIMGAAINTLIAFFILFILSLIISNKYYRIEFEKFRLTLLFVIGMILFLISSLIKIENLLLDISFKLLLILIFPLVLFFTSFYQFNEIRIIIAIIKKWKNPSDWISNLKNEGTNFFNKD